jgi:hypothetical protein
MSPVTTVLMDTSDPGSVRTAVGLIDAPMRAVVMNAGGTGGSAPMAATKTASQNYSRPTCLAMSCSSSSSSQRAR